MSELEVGARLCSVVCSTEVMAIAVPAEGATIFCGGAVMRDATEAETAGGTMDPAAAEGTQLGKRYTNAAGDLELLCVKPGEGSLAVDGEALVVKGAKPLPSSD